MAHAGSNVFLGALKGGTGWVECKQRTSILASFLSNCSFLFYKVRLISAALVLSHSGANAFEISIHSELTYDKSVDVVCQTPK